MPLFMKSLNNISRSQAVFRHSKISADDLHPAHYAFAIGICKNPGRSQEELARELCLNKSTVARALTVLEERGYVKREGKYFVNLPSREVQIQDDIPYLAYFANGGSVKAFMQNESVWGEDLTKYKGFYEAVETNLVKLTKGESLL